MSSDNGDRPISVRATEIVPDDPARIRLQKLARITLDSMVQFVGLLDAAGTVLEINKVAPQSDGTGHGSDFIVRLPATAPSRHWRSIP